jgi:hypothetical protein
VEREKQYRDCVKCGKHVGEITTEKSVSYSQIRYYLNADVLMMARTGKTYCRDCANDFKGRQI